MNHAELITKFEFAKQARAEVLTHNNMLYVENGLIKIKNETGNWRGSSRFSHFLDKALTMQADAVIALAIMLEEKSFRELTEQVNIACRELTQETNDNQTRYE